MVRSIPTPIKILLLTLSSVFLLLPDLSSANELNPDDVVATVDGEPVYYDYFLVDAHGYELKFWVKEGRKPTSKKDRETVRKKIEEDNLFNLREAIDYIFRERWIKKQKLVVSDAELDQYWKQFKSIIEMKADLNQKEFDESQKSLRLALEAGKAIYDEEKDSDLVFEEFKKATSYSESRAQWELEIYSLMRPEFRKTAEKQLIQTLDEVLEDQKQEFRTTHALEFKIDCRVHELIAKNDKSMQEWLNKNPPKFDLLTWEYIEDPMYEKRLLFWQELFQKADIKILDPKYKKVLELVPTSWSQRWKRHLRLNLR